MSACNVNVQGRVWDGVMQPSSLRMSAFRGKIDGIPVLLLRPDWGACNLFKGSRIYGGSYNELEAYLVFSRCAMDAVINSKWKLGVCSSCVR